MLCISPFRSNTTGDSYILLMFRATTFSSYAASLARQNSKCNLHSMTFWLPQHLPKHVSCTETSPPNLPIAHSVTLPARFLLLSVSKLRTTYLQNLHLALADASSDPAMSPKATILALYQSLTSDELAEVIAELQDYASRPWVNIPVCDSTLSHSSQTNSSKRAQYLSRRMTVADTYARSDLIKPPQPLDTPSRD